jgi:hypothetical protein
MEGKLNAAVQQRLRLTTEQWRDVERELNVCLKEHRITAAEYLAAMTELKALRKPHDTASRPRR